jgi:hypothetical protein
MPPTPLFSFELFFMALNSTVIKLFLAVGIPLTFAGCQSSLQPSALLNMDADLQQCVNLAREFRQDVAASDANNAAVTPLIALPFLATNRFHSALARDAKTGAQIDEWVQMAVGFGAESREFENQTLAAPWTDNRLAQLTSCSQLFARSKDYSANRREAVRGAVIPADNYRALPQWLGLYALLRPIFKSRIDKLHVEERRWFAEEENFANPVAYGLTDQATNEPYGLAEWFHQAYSASALGVPTLSEAQLAELFELHAPQFEIDTQASRDSLGTPTLNSGSPVIDTSGAIAYTLPSFTRFNGANLLQLNYVVWFPERGPVGPVDLFAGAIDSLIWRVTLDETGQVLLYDSAHSCGCYHKYFLANENLKIKQPALSEEPANLITLSSLNTHQGVRLIVSSNEHYILGIRELKAKPDRPYALADYSALYALPSGAAKASLFGPTGIIDGSERLERFTLWPTGIESVGAMRQWGTHATGFVDRQHFDDAALFDNYLIID